MKTPVTTILNLPKLINAAMHLPSIGKLAISQNNLIYLDIDDEYVHQLFPLLENQLIKKPDYFGKGLAGAHITVIYPEEKTIFKKEDLSQEYRFTIKDIVTAEIGLKTYYVLLVESDTLLQLRRKYHLTDLLCFKGYAIGFHVTIGVNA